MLYSSPNLFHYICTMRNTLHIFIICLGSVCLYSNPADSFSLSVITTDQQIVIDGNLDEDAWKNAAAGSDFWQWFPSDSSLADGRTELYMLRDENYLYVAAVCYTAGDDFQISSLKRDYRAGGNDNLSLLFDPFNDRRNAFLFGMNAYGVKREALVTDGGSSSESFNSAWDNRWEGASTRYEDRYVCEFAIPFTTLRYLDGSSRWSFNAYRFDTQYNEWSVWTHIPQNQQFYKLSFMGDMLWQDPLGKTGTNVAIIPYATGGIAKDHEASTPAEAVGDIGLDAKVAVTPGLNLDLTINPDFSQVEVDRQQTNLTRFELFLPERRQFFLENADLFGSFGGSAANPFFSRRIGIATDTITGLTVQNRIWGGARLSGKLTDDIRVGVLNMQASRDQDNGLPSYNFGVVAIQKAIKNRSSIGAIMVNKQHFSKEPAEDAEKFNRVFGMDYNYQSFNNRWDGKVFYHRSVSDQQKEKAYSQGGVLNYTGRNIKVEWQHVIVGEGYDAKVGFVPRTGYFGIEPEIEYTFYPQNRSKVVNHGPGISLEAQWTPGFGRSDEELSLFWDFQFAGNERGRVFVERNFTHLFDPFDPTRTDSEELPADQNYTYYQVGAFLSTNQAKKFYHFLIIKYGEFFNGKVAGFDGRTTYRFQPYGTLALSYEINRVRLPNPYASATLLLVGPRLDLTFSKKLFLTALVQYNNQIDNLNVNARLQWRYKSVSDFYLVYTDNYQTENFFVRNRSIVAKVTYWLNT